MTKESLQKYCDSKGLKIKILDVVPPYFSGDDYEYSVVYTFDLTYMEDNYSNSRTLVKPERVEYCRDKREFFLAMLNILLRVLIDKTEKEDNLQNTVEEWEKMINEL